MTEETRHRPRYRPRAVSDDDTIRRILRRHPWGTLTAVQGGEPVPTPLLYVYEPDAHVIDTHVSPEGRIASVARAGSRGTFTVASMGEIISAETAGSFDLEYESVIASGEVGLVEEPGPRRAALARLMEKFAPDEVPGDDYRPITEEEVEETAVVRLTIDEWSAKRNGAEPTDRASEFDPQWRSDTP